MDIIEKIREKADSLKKQSLALYYAAQHGSLPWLTRILIVFTLAYALSPVDLIPDFIPVLGYLDDFIILPLLISLCIRSIPEHIMGEAEKEAERNPLSLKKNWIAGTIIILIWTALLLGIAIKAFNAGP